jgi:hypothetical protein
MLEPAKMNLIDLNCGNFMRFIKSRLNRDNLTNILFWLSMNLGLAVSSLFDEISIVLARVFFWMTVIFVPLIIRDFSGIAFVGNKTFLNSKGENLASKYPKRLGIFIFLTLAGTAFSGLIMNAYLEGGINVTMLISIFFLIPTLYFIYKNCPISILFYKTGWDKEITGITPTDSRGIAAYHAEQSDRDRRYSTSCSSLMGVIFFINGNIL